MSQTVNLQITLSDEQIDQFIKQGVQSIVLNCKLNKGDVRSEVLCNQ